MIHMILELYSAHLVLAIIISMRRILQYVVLLEFTNFYTNWIKKYLNETTFYKQNTFNRFPNAQIRQIGNLLRQKLKITNLLLTISNNDNNPPKIEGPKPPLRERSNENSKSIISFRVSE